VNNSQPVLAIFPPSEQDSEDIKKWFRMPGEELTPLQKQAHASIMTAGRVFAMSIQRNLPRCADRGAALMRIREAMERAFMGIASERGAYVDKETKKHE
jgi:hypothetical protein